MKKQTVQKILHMNRDFYQSVAEDFSSTRQYYWKGWEKVGEIVKKRFQENSKIKVCDLGCGNGRFYKFLRENLTGKNIEYFGYDISDDLRREAQSRYSKNNNHKVHITKLDIFEDLPCINTKFELVVGFGITQHIPSRELRINWFKDVANLSSKQGILVLTFWDFTKDPRFEDRVIENIPGIELGDLEKNDFFLGWDNKNGIYRYFHSYNQEEIEEITNIMVDGGLELLETFYSDGRSQNLNKYLILSKHG